MLDLNPSIWLSNYTRLRHSRLHCRLMEPKTSLNFAIIVPPLLQSTERLTGDITIYIQVDASEDIVPTHEGSFEVGHLISIHLPFSFSDPAVGPAPGTRK